MSKVRQKGRVSLLHANSEKISFVRTTFVTYLPCSRNGSTDMNPTFWWKILRQWLKPDEQIAGERHVSALPARQERNDLERRKVEARAWFGPPLY
jgi:hypothetical protein